jgi:hypothetical protein
MFTLIACVAWLISTLFRWIAQCALWVSDGLDGTYWWARRRAEGSRLK